MQTSLAWGSVSNLVDKIGDIEEKMDGGWDELVEMVAETITEEGTTKNTAEIFSYVFNFMYNLLFRLKSNPQKRDFNITTKEIVDGESIYRITNYDYKSFKWAKSNELAYKINNDCIDILADKLTDAQKTALDGRCN